MGAFVKAVNTAKQDDVSMRHVERLSDLVFEIFSEAFRRALVGESPAMVSRPYVGSSG